MPFGLEDELEVPVAPLLVVPVPVVPVLAVPVLVVPVESVPFDDVLEGGVWVVDPEVDPDVPPVDCRGDDDCCCCCCCCCCCEFCPLAGGCRGFPVAAQAKTPNVSEETAIINA